MNNCQLFNKLLLDARSSFIDAEFKISNIFDAPHMNEVVRLNRNHKHMLKLMAGCPDLPH